MSIETVSSITQRVCIPAFQRSEDNEHIQHIYDSVASALENHEEPMITGCLIVVVVSDDTSYLLDGNHRLNAYYKVLNEIGYDLKVFVNTIHVTSDEQAELLFNQTNTCLPVATMPDGIKRSCVNQIAEHFYQRSSPKKGAPLFRGCKTNRPRIQKSNFEEVIAKIIKSNPDITTDTIIRKIEEYERQLNSKTATFFKRNSDTNNKIAGMLNKADMLGSRLGLVRSNDIVRIFGLCAQGTFERQKENIPKALKMSVWNRYCGTEARYSHCPFCKNRINIEDFHCAHDIAAANGGELSVDNLYPCCSGCNLSMGTSTYEQFLAKMGN